MKHAFNFIIMQMINQIENIYDKDLDVIKTRLSQNCFKLQGLFDDNGMNKYQATLITPKLTGERHNNNKKRLC